MGTLEHLIEAAANARRSTSASSEKLVSQLREIIARRRGNQLRVAVLGQFKRGKSTLINALLGLPLLLTGILPVTAIPTVIRFGSRLRLEVRFKDDRQPIVEHDGRRLKDCLTRYVSEAGNPNNELLVADVTVEAPVEFLASGIVLVDTPGVGSIFVHNTEAARAALKEADVAIFVTSPEPPFTEVEQSFLAEIRQIAPKLFFVLNKFDTLAIEDQTAALRFLTTSIERAMPGAGEIRIFPASARNAISAGLAGDAKGCADSGLTAMRDALASELASEKEVIADEAVRRRGVSVIENMIFEAEMELRALQLPLDELTNKLTTFSLAIEGFRKEAVSIGDQAEADQKGLIRQLEAYSERLWRVAKRDYQEVLRRLLERHCEDVSVLRDEIGKVIATRFEAESKRLTEAYRLALHERMNGLQRRAFELSREVRVGAAMLMEVAVIDPVRDDGIEMKRETYWVAPEERPSLGTFAAGGLHRFLPPALRRRLAHHRLAEEVERAVLRNVSALEWALRQNIQDAYRAFQFDLREQLEQAMTSTQAVMTVARERRRENAASSSGHVDALAASIRKLKASLARLAQSHPDHAGD